MSVPFEISLLEIEDEISSARAWAKRHHLNIEWFEEQLELRMVLIQSNSGHSFYLKGIFDDYKEIPPKWIFTDSSWHSNVVRSNYPKGVATPFGSSIFHPNAVICAPFNRLAYKTHSGPHSDWGTPAQWRTAARNYVVADTIGDMLSIILRDFKFTTTRLK